MVFVLVQIILKWVIEPDLFLVFHPGHRPILSDRVVFEFPAPGPSKAPGDLDLARLPPLGNIGVHHR